MSLQIKRLSVMVFAVLVLSASLTWATGFRLGETKEQLELMYDISVTDHGTGRVTIHLTLADEGRLKPLRSVAFVVPGNDETGYEDLALSMALQKDGDKQTAHVLVKKELAERAEIQFITNTFDGNHNPLTWHSHPIPIAKFLKNEDSPK